MKKNRVEATLLYGRNMPQWCVNFIIGALVFAILAFIMTIALLTYYQEDNLLLVLVPFYVAIIICFVGILVATFKMKKNIKLWVENAIETEGYCSCIDRNYLGTKIAITFSYDGKMVSRNSGLYKDDPFRKNDGYSRYFSRYVDKQLKIMYNSQYDELMILSS